MALEDKEISRLILDSFFSRFKRILTCDVAVVGSGPAGMVCSYFLAKRGIKTVLFERKGSLGGGIWGGGMMFNSIVLQKSAQRLLDEFNIKYQVRGNQYLVANAPEFVSAISLSACQAGVEVFNFISAEDVMTKANRVTGLVLNWTAVGMAGFHVDPISLQSKYVVDATGHDAEVSRVLFNKLRRKAKGLPIGEKSMNAEIGEQEVVRNSKEIFPGLFVAGMAANAIFGGHRMGPIFGGMILSGEKVAQLIIKKLGKGKKR